jgi:hypothetical protein
MLTINHQCLNWPPEVPRASTRRYMHRTESWNDAVQSLYDIFYKLKVTEATLMTAWNPSDPYITDPAVCIEFWLDGVRYIQPYDRYARPEHNLMAIVEVLQAYHIQAKYGMVIIKSSN